MTTEYIALLVQQLKQSGQLEAILAHPSVQDALKQMQPAPKRYVLDDLLEDEVVFITAYRSFLLTETGNMYVGMASKFARYLQSVVDKAKAEESSTGGSKQ